MTISIAYAVPTRQLAPLYLLLEAGWSINCYGKIQYLPLGDDDNYDWELADLSTWPDVKMLFQQKVDNSEQVGIGLSYNDSQNCGSFIFTPDGRIEILLFGDRVTMASTQQFSEIRHPFTDFSWYIDKIIPALLKAGIMVDSMTCHEIV